MFEHAVYSVISPEGCASILWRTADKAADAAEAMKITAADLHALGRRRPDRRRSRSAARIAIPTRRSARSRGRSSRSSTAAASLGPNELREQRRAKFLAIG